MSLRGPSNHLESHLFEHRKVWVPFLPEAFTVEPWVPAILEARPGTLLPLHGQEPGKLIAKLTHLPGQQASRIIEMQKYF